MAQQKIRLGIIGANVRVGWASRSHLPAAPALPDFELAGVCTTKAESAEEAKQKYGARMAFNDYREMVAHPQIDAVSVVLRVPAHFEHAMAALDAGKHVYCEWPLGQTTAQAMEMAAKARAKDVRHIVGLQARVEPSVLYAKQLVAEGYVGDVLAVNQVLVREGVLERTSEREWQVDEACGAHTLTIATGHSLDAIRYMLGEFAEVQATIGTQTRSWLITDRKKTLHNVSAPDTVSVSGRLANGAIVSAQVAHMPYAGSAYRLEIYGSKGTLVLAGADSPQMASLKLSGAQGSNTLQPLVPPAQFTLVPPEAPRGLPFNVAQLYRVFAEAIRSGKNIAPDFDTAVSMHRFIDKLRESSKSGARVML